MYLSLYCFDFDPFCCKSVSQLNGSALNHGKIPKKLKFPSLRGHAQTLILICNQNIEYEIQPV